MNEQQHILSAFDRDLEAIQAHIMKMGGMVEASILDAAKSFDTRDVELAADVRARDKAIDQLEILINDEATKLLALRSPTAIDLRLVLSVIKVASNLERIGDFSKNMAKRTTVLMEMPHVFDKGQGLRRLAREVELMLKDALDAYVQRDVQSCRVRRAECRWSRRRSSRLRACPSAARGWRPAEHDGRGSCPGRRCRRG